MKRPAFQFYPADWRHNANLRRCSPAARGVWMDVLCVLHDSDEYGTVRWPLVELANAAGAPIKLVRELVEKSVLKGHDKNLLDAFVYVPRSGRKTGPPVTLLAIQPGPIWYSSRMVRDEYVRTIRGESTRFGECDGESPKTPPKAPKGDGSTSSSSPSVSEAKASDAADAPAGGQGKQPKTPDDMAKAELWRAAVSVLEQGGCPTSQCRTFMGKLVTDYTFPVVQKAVASAVTTQPADAREYLKATCQRLKGERSDPITVASDAAEKTQQYLASQTLSDEQKEANAESARRAREQVRAAA